MNEKLIGTVEAGERAGITRVGIFFAIKKDQLKAEKIGRDYVIRESDFKHWLENRRPRGRPPANIETKASDEEPVLMTADELVWVFKSRHPLNLNTELVWPHVIATSVHVSKEYNSDWPEGKWVVKYKENSGRRIADKFWDFEADGYLLDEED